MMVSHQASVPKVASVNVGKDQGHVRNLIVELTDVFPSRQARRLNELLQWRALDLLMVGL